MKIQVNTSTGPRDKLSNVKTSKTKMYLEIRSLIINLNQFVIISSLHIRDWSSKSKFHRENTGKVHNIHEVQNII